VREKLVKNIEQINPFYSTYVKGGSTAHHKYLARARKSEICRDKEERQKKEKNTSVVPNRHIYTRCTQRCDVKSS